jgi:alpha-tubulin suppressor-like RCC1 family protein
VPVVGEQVMCWGLGFHGELGYGNVENVGDDEAPRTVGVVAVGGEVSALAAGAEHTCAVVEGGGVRCWGGGGAGRLGYGNTTSIGDNETPAMVGDVPGLTTITQLAAGAVHTCGLTAQETVVCWGSATVGQLGYGNVNDIGDNEAPGQFVVVGGPVKQIVAGGLHTCALLATGAVRCWGLGLSGRLGHGNSTSVGDNETPDSAGDVDLGGVAQQLAAGNAHTCALLNNGAVRCWGQNDVGQLGYSNTANIGDNESPAVAGNVPLGGAAVAITAGNAHTCALLENDDVICWGGAAFGQLGYGDTGNVGDNETPQSRGPVPLD